MDDLKKNELIYINLIVKKIIIFFFLPDRLHSRQYAISSGFPSLLFKQVPKQKSQISVIFGVCFCISISDSGTKLINCF